MSPWRSQGVVQAGVAVVQRDAPVEGLIEMDFGSGKAEALPLLRDLETLSLPLHDVVVADHAFMDETADTVEIFRGRTPGGLAFAGTAGEAAIEVGDESPEHDVGGVEIASLSQTEFAAQAILEHTPQTFDAAFGLRTASGDKSDAELIERASELGGLTFSGELFWQGPEVVVAHEDAAVISVEGERSAVAAQQRAQQREISERGLGGKNWAARIFPVASSCRPSAVRRGPRPSSQSWGEPSSCTSSPSRAERSRRWRCAGARRLRGEPSPDWRNSRRRVSRLTEKPSTSQSFSQRW